MQVLINLCNIPQQEAWVLLRLYDHQLCLRPDKKSMKTEIKKMKIRSSMFKNQSIFIYSKYKYKKDVSITVQRSLSTNSVMKKLQNLS